MNRVLITALVVAAIAALWLITRIDVSPPTNIADRSQQQTEVAAPEIETSQSDWHEDRTLYPIPMFVQIDEANTAVLGAWYDDVFIPDYDVPESIIRSNFVSVDAEFIQQELTRSLDAGQMLGETSDASVELNLFPDSTYKIVVNRYRLGSTGFKNFRARVLESQGHGQEYFQFEIAPDGRVFGRGVTSSGTFTFHPAPGISTLLILEIDEHIAHREIRVD